MISNILHHVNEDKTLQQFKSQKELILMISFVNSTNDSIVKQFLEIFKSLSIFEIISSSK